MDRLLRGPEGSRRGGDLTSDGAGKINPRGLRQLSKAYRLWRLMNILWANLKQEIKLRLLGRLSRLKTPGRLPAAESSRAAASSCGGANWMFTSRSYIARRGDTRPN